MPLVITFFHFTPFDLVIYFSQNLFQLESMMHLTFLNRDSVPSLILVPYLSISVFSRPLQKFRSGKSHHFHDSLVILVQYVI